MTSIGKLADELLEAIALEDMKSFQKNGFYTTFTKAGDCKVLAIALEDMKSFQKNGFYTTFTKAGDCKVLVFDLPNEQRKLEDFNIWRGMNEPKRILD